MDSVTPQALIRIWMRIFISFQKRFLLGSIILLDIEKYSSVRGGKEPRIISIPTVRDKLALAAYHLFLHDSFKDVIEEPLLHTIVGNITHEVLSERYDGYVKNRYYKILCFDKSHNSS